MNSDEIIKLYAMVREKNCINDKNLITKDFILKLLNASAECFNNDLEALNFLLEISRIVLASNKVVSDDSGK